MIKQSKTTFYNRLLSYLSNNKNTKIIYNSIISLQSTLSTSINLLKSILSYWTFNITAFLIIYYILGQYFIPQLLEDNSQAIKNQYNLRYAIKGSLIYGLGFIIVMTIHQTYDNDYMNVLKANNRQGYKRLVFFNIRMGIFYYIALRMPANKYTNRSLAFLTLYIWLSQQYVRKSILNNIHTIVYRRMQFVNNFTMNQATSLVFIFSPLFSNLFPQLQWLPGLVTLLPMLWRFAQCFIVGTHQQFLNSIKFTFNLLGFAFGIVQMSQASHYFRIIAAIYSFYWDVFRDWKWKIRFYENKDYRIHLPVGYLLFGLLYDIFGRSIWIIMPMNFNVRGIVQITRRLAWDILRIERQQVFYYPRPKGNHVKDLFSK